MALGLINEAIGKGLRMVAMPSMNYAQERHPAYPASVSVLRAAGVTMMVDGEGHAVGRADPDDPASYPWDLALEALAPARRVTGPTT